MADKRECPTCKKKGEVVEIVDSRVNIEIQT
ncbi:MAG: hypothetical protein MRECE_2c108 [Mycoplasmataceae bacterium CE_OT135]|nr:MAG: hypothetical protein MRECE_2c108 [Mycoplasmataceae bacterium CE_OT135]